MARISEQHHILHGARAHARRRMMFKFIAWWMAALALIGGGTYALVETDALIVQEVRVEGVRLADHEKVKEALAAAAMRPPRSWFGEQLTPFWLFLGAPKSFLAAFPMFRDVTVRTDVFSRTVTIRAEERELYGVWCRSGGDCYAFDREGIVFGEAPDTRGTLIARVMDARTEPLVNGEAVLTDAGWRGRILETLAVIHALKLTPRTITVHEDALREWEVALAEGPTLRFSFTFVPERLEDALASLSRRGDFRTLTYLDFRVPDRLYYK